MRRTVAAFTVDAIGSPEAVTASGPCRIIRVREQSGASVGFNVRAPLTTSPPVEYQPGEEVTFSSGDNHLFQPGEVVGYIETLSGSASFSQQEAI